MPIRQTPPLHIFFLNYPDIYLLHDILIQKSVFVAVLATVIQRQRVLLLYYSALLRLAQLSLLQGIENDIFQTPCKK